VHRVPGAVGALLGTVGTATEEQRLGLDRQLTHPRIAKRSAGFAGVLHQLDGPVLEGEYISSRFSRGGPRFRWGPSTGGSMGTSKTHERRQDTCARKILVAEPCPRRQSPATSQLGRRARRTRRRIHHRPGRARYHTVDDDRRLEPGRAPAGPPGPNRRRLPTR
jgi:hypothetical protein